MKEGIFVDTMLFGWTTRSWKERYRWRLWLRLCCRPRSRPVTYHIRLSPNLTAFTFAGEETVEIEVLEPTSRIVVNAAELEIQEAHLLQDGQRTSAQAIVLDEEAETATLTFAAPLPTGTSQLFMRFTGILNEKLRGFYRSEYTLPDGTKRIMATTQFEAPDARRAFPCWDEPAHKAQF